VSKSSRNRRIVFASRPKGELTLDAFHLETAEIPTPGKNQMLLRTLWLSLDPYMRTRLYETDSYMPGVRLGEVMVGGTVSRVEASNHPDFRVGDVVHLYAGWQDYMLSDGSDVIVKLPPGMSNPSWYLGALGMPGFTAWYGLNKIGKPHMGETLVVAAATGAVGQIVGQLAKQQGCRVVGIAGGVKKCAYATSQFEFDACIDHYAKNFPEQLAAACPQGVDIYFESVGGAVFDAVVPLLNVGARVPVCGLISHYSGGEMGGVDRLPGFLSKTLFKRLKVEGFIIFDHYSEFYAAFVSNMTSLIENGDMKLREDVLDSLELAPNGLIALLKGGNFGKLVVHVGD